MECPDGFLPDVSDSHWGGVGNMANSHWGGVGDGNWGWMGHGHWDSNLGLDSLAVLLGDLLDNLVTVNSLLEVALGDWDGLGDSLGRVDANLLGHLTAVRLDCGVAGSHGSWGVHNCRSSMGNNSWGGSMGHVWGSNAVSQKTGSGSPGLGLGLGLSASLPLDDAVDRSMWASTDLGGDLLALLLESDGLLLDVLGVAHLLSLRNTVLSLDFLKSEGALWSGYGVLGCGHSNMSHSEAVASVVGISVSIGGRGSVGHSSGNARISDKLVHGDLDIVVTSHEELSS